jgi:proton glutamate symport protein
MKKFPLHLQIIIALILGAFFGAFFNVAPNKIKITYESGSGMKTKIVDSWERIKLEKESQTVQAPEQENIFGENDQIQIIKSFKKLKKGSGNTKTVTKVDLIETDSEGKEIARYKNVTSVAKIPTIATKIKPLGTLFINLLSFLAIPLVISSLIVGAASLEDVRKLGRIGSKTLFIYIFTTAVAISIGILTANLIEPGTQVPEDSRNRLLGAFEEESSERIVDNLEIDILDFIVGIVPKNPFDAITSGNMLQIVFIAVMFGITITFIERDKAKTVLNFFSGVSEVMIKMVEIIMKIAPIGVFALMASTIADFGFEILSTLVWYILAVIIGLLIQTVIVYPALVKFIGKFSVPEFFRGIRNAQAIAFSTSSSAATLPVTLDCVENNLKAPKKIAGFVLPLGATINMDGTALYQGVAAIFIAQVYGIDLGLSGQLTIIFTAVLASIGTAPVPGVGIIMLVMILQSVNIPPQGIALILGVDRILDMMRTVTNVTGDSAVTMAVAGSEARRN